MTTMTCLLQATSQAAPPLQVEVYRPPSTYHRGATYGANVQATRDRLPSGLHKSMVMPAAQSVPGHAPGHTPKIQGS